MKLREGTLDDCASMAAMFRRMWLDNGIPEQSLAEDAEERVRAFVTHGQRHLGLRMFLASEGGRDVGGAACQLFAGLYPDILSPALRRYGYVWGVYVVPSARRRGLGRTLTARCAEALREAGCTHALLHAAPMGRGVYHRLGFESTNEMRLDLLAPSNEGSGA